MKDALQETATGVRIQLDAAPGAAEAQFPAGYNEWRQRIGVRCVAPAQDGRANQEILALVAAFFEQPRSSVVLVAGARDGRKTVHVQGLAMDTALATLEADGR